MLGFDHYALIFVFVNLLFASVWVSNTRDDELRNRRGDVVALLMIATGMLCYRCWFVAARAAPDAPSVFSADTVWPAPSHTTMTLDCTGRYRVSPELQSVGGR